MGEQHDGISRPAAVAGYFYPGDARSLDREVESLMREGEHLLQSAGCRTCRPGSDRNPNFRKQHVVR